MEPKKPRAGSTWRHPKRLLMNVADIPGTTALQEWETPDCQLYVTSSVERADDSTPEHHHLVCSRLRGVITDAEVQRVLADFDAADLIPFRLPGSTTRHFFTKGVMPG